MGKCIGGITHDVFGSVERLPTILLTLIWIFTKGHDKPHIGVQT